MPVRYHLDVRNDEIESVSREAHEKISSRMNDLSRIRSKREVMRDERQSHLDFLMGKDLENEYILIGEHDDGVKWIVSRGKSNIVRSFYKKVLKEENFGKTSYRVELFEDYIRSLRKSP